MSLNKKTRDHLYGLISYLENIQQDIDRAVQTVHKLLDGEDPTLTSEEISTTTQQKLTTYTDENAAVVVEGIYDGYFMIGADGKKYPVGLNYASKSKLIPGDVLKLRIMKDGKLIYKIIGEAPRKFIKATLSQSEENKYIALTDDGNIYYLNHAAVTFFKGTVGSQLSIIVNAKDHYDYAAIEAILHTTAY